jgi:DNA-binding transcriptional MerR regulator
MELLTIPEVAHMLRVKPATVRRWIKSDVLQAIILPHSGHRRTEIRVRLDIVQAILASKISKPEANAQ